MKILGSGPAASRAGPDSSCGDGRMGRRDGWAGRWETCRDLIPAGSVFASLAEHRGELSPAEMFADMYPSANGRPSMRRRSWLPRSPCRPCTGCRTSRRSRNCGASCGGRQDAGWAFSGGIQLQGLNNQVRTCLLALGLAGDLCQQGFCWSRAVDSGAWWSSLVAIGHCRATSDGPGTALLWRARLTPAPLMRPV